MDTNTNQSDAWIQEFYQDLQTLVNSAFPKTCANCGKVYKDSHTFLTETTPVKDVDLQERSGLFSMDFDKSNAAVGVFRNCICGSTLLANFQDRRDLSARGNERRKQFDKLLRALKDHGVSEKEGRAELRALLRGKECPKLQEWLGEKVIKNPLLP
jgi:hypothetical protein